MMKKVLDTAPTIKLSLPHQELLRTPCRWQAPQCCEETAAVFMCFSDRVVM